VSLVDDRNANAARRQIQSDLPRTLHHAATGETSFTILHVDFLRGGCLGCLFAPSAEDLNPMTGVADLTGIPLARVSQMGPAGLLDSGDLESIRRRWGFDEKDLIAFLGRPLQVLIDSRICGEQRIVTHSGRFNASIGFLSAAAGIALAAEVVKTTSGLPRYTLDNFLQVSPFSPADLSNRRLPKNPRCGILCGDPLMRQAYVDKWAIGIR